MINTIIFDFGDIFINLDKEATITAFKKLGLSEWNTDLNNLNMQFETGKISRENFLSGIQKHIPNASIQEIETAWCTILLDFPLYRLEFLQILSQKYRLFLLSNTDAIHIESFEQKHGISFIAISINVLKKCIFRMKLVYENLI